MMPVFSVLLISMAMCKFLNFVNFTGDVFMRKYFTTFDRDGVRCGFALSRDAAKVKGVASPSVA